MNALLPVDNTTCMAFAHSVPQSGNAEAVVGLGKQRLPLLTASSLP